ncbi:MAG: tetratricopeptide repeat protein [Candidatus Sulfotelmatobacter sp.]|jgi:tetratricopeptide (TPR) repeat protein
MALNSLMTAYRAADYALALEETEKLKRGGSKTPEYCFYRGALLHKLGQFVEAEAILREGLPLQPDDRFRALTYNTLAEVLMDQKRFDESIECFRNAGRAWPGRGSNLRGVAEVWLRQGDHLAEALESARQAVEIDRRADGMVTEALDQRLGEDLGVLAWAVAANSGSLSEVEPMLTEAFRLCGTRSKPVLAQLHYHAGRAYKAIQERAKSQEHFRNASEIEPQGVFGRLAHAEMS